MSKDLIKKISKNIRLQFLKDGSGHDWWHIDRVWKISKNIAKKEKGSNLLLVELIALTHELGDYKLEKDSVNRQEERIKEFLEKHKVATPLLEKVIKNASSISWNKNINNKQELSLEGRIVQDADRLEAIGAIGIARVFAYAGHKNNLIHDPRVSPKLGRSPKFYRNYRNTAINHFYEKLLLVKNSLNTKTGKKLAEHRQRFMENYLKEFYSEWDGLK